MTAYKSTQETKRTATPPKKLSANELGGRQRVAYFDYVTPAGGVAINDTIDLVTLPAGARIFGGAIAFEAMSSAAGTAQVQIGTAAAANKYLDTTSVDGAGSVLVANTVALAFGEELAADTTIVAKALGEAWAAAKRFTGWIEYALD